MATKASISQILKIITSNEHTKLIDVFFTLSKISIQFKEEQTCRSFFIIYTESDSYCNLCKVIKKEAPYFRSRTTLTSCIKTLVKMRILEYSKGEGGWVIREMDEMFNNGYIMLRKIFFTELFYNLNITEKKALVYAVYIMSTKGYKSVNKIMINLKDEQSKWRNIFKSNNIYYLRKRIQSILSKFFRDISSFSRKKELEEYREYEKDVINKKKRLLSFKFSYQPNKLIKEVLNRNNKKQVLEELRDSDPGFYGYLYKLRNRLEDKIRVRFTDKIMISLLTCCKALSYQNKQYIAERIVKKLYDKNEISSPDKYIGKIVGAYMQEI